MTELYNLETKKLQKKQLWYYLIPVFGALPAFWTLYRSRGSKDQQQASRLSVVLLLTWLIPYISLFTGASQASDLMSFRLLYANALLTTSYFLMCFWLLFRLQQGKSPRLPMINSLGKKKGKL